MATMIPRILLAMVLLVQVASGQTLTNGSFETGDFTGWQTAGVPAVVGAPPTPTDGSDQALINSTGASAGGVFAGANAVSADALNTFLNTTLPGNAKGAAINGEAIQQTFSTTEGATVSFSYAYQAHEAPGDDFDETGYVLNGVFHILADTNSPGDSMANGAGFLFWGVPYRTITVSVGPGTNTIGFVAYNTGNAAAPSALFVDDVIVTPIPPVASAPVNPPGSVSSQGTGASGVNASGSYSDSGGVQHGFFYNGFVTSVVDPAGTTATVATSVSGTNVAGWYNDSSSVQHGFFFDGTNYTTLDPLGSTDTFATGVSGANVAGWFKDGGGVQHGFFYNGSAYTTVDPSGSTDTQATAVSGSNVVGWYNDGSAVQHGFFFDGTNYTVIDPPGSIDTQATGVSGANVVGWYKDAGGVQHGFFFSGTTYTTLDPPGSADTVATAVSGSNVVGWYNDSGGVQHGFFYSGGAYAIADPTGSTDTQVTGVSGTNVVGWYDDNNSVQHAFAGTVSKTGATVTLDNYSPVYDGSPQSPTAVTSPAGLSVTYTYNGSTTAPTAAGTYTVVAMVNDPSYQGSAVATMIITPAPVTVTLGSLTATYDGTPKAATATTNPTGVSVAFTYTDSGNNTSSTAPTAAGTYAVVGTVSDPNYTGSASGSLVISQATATVTLGSLTAAYDGTPKAATATTNPPGLVVTYTYTDSGNNTSAAAPTAIGSYTVVGTINDPNYQGSDTETLTITQGTATVTLGNLMATYDGTPKSATAMTNPAGLSVTFLYNGSATPPTAAGMYPVVATVNDPNYQGTTSGTLVIAQATASVTLGSLTATYDGTAKAITATTNPVGLTVTFMYNGSATAPTNAGSYPVVGTISDPNYQGTASGTLVINKATATVTLGSLAATYDGTAKAATATTSPVGLTVTFLYNSSAPAPITAGSYSVVGTISDVNYQGNASGTLVIAQATATVTLGSLAATYDGTAKAATATTSPAGLTVAFMYNGSPTAPINAGSYTVVGTISDTNYQGMASGTLVIGKATAAVTLGSLNAAYDGTPKSVTATTSPTGLTVMFLYNGSASAPSAAGSYPIVATVNDANYQGTASGTLVIGQANATVTLGSLAATYDGTAKAATATTSPVGLTVTFMYNGSATVPINAGSYTVIGAINDPNYQGSATGTLVIGQATATVTLGSLAATYDGTAKSATATTGPVGLTVTFMYNGSATVPINAGSYTVVGTISDPNYQGSATSTLVIGKATGTVTLGNLAASADGTPKSATATTTPTGLNVTFTYNGNASPPSAVGSYTVVGTINDTNYQGNATGTLVISTATTNYSQWAAANSVTGGPSGTPEHDGVPNLLKYLFDIDPTRPMTSADLAALPVIGMTTVNGVDYLTLTYREYQMASGISVNVQTSTDMRTWTSFSNPPLSQQIGTDPVTGDPIMQVGVVAVTSGKQFIRLNVTMP